jgi:hypothetical protein
VAIASTRRTETANSLNIPRLFIATEKRRIHCILYTSRATIENTCDKDFSYVQVQMTVYRHDGTVVDRGLANVNNIKAGETWSWKTIQSDDSGTWDVTNISGV